MTPLLSDDVKDDNSKPTALLVSLSGCLLATAVIIIVAVAAIIKYRRRIARHRDIIAGALTAQR